MICIKNGTLHTAVSKETFIADILIDGGKIVRSEKVSLLTVLRLSTPPDSRIYRDLLRPIAIRS